MNDTRPRSTSLQEPTVGAWMAAQPIVVDVDAPLADAARLMDGRHVHGLPVVDAEGRLVGVVSQTDLARARATEFLWQRWPGLTVRHLMTAPAVTALASMPLDQAARLMESRGIHRLIVVADDDETRPIGVLSMTDLIHAIAEEAGPAPTPASAGALVPAPPAAVAPASSPEAPDAR